MSRDVSLMVTARDNYSSAIRKMATTTRSFKNDMKGLESKLVQLNKNKTTLQVNTEKAKSQLMEAKKQFRKTTDEASRLKLEAAQADYNNISDNLKLVSSQAKQTEKDMESLTDELSRHQNRAQGSGTRKGAALGTASMLKQIGAAGATQMLGDSISNAADTMIGSAFGTTVGGAISSTIGKAASGAAIGTMIAPGIGTAIGAAAGAVAGAVDGAMQIYEEKDDYFKQYVHESYDTVKQEYADMLTSGSDIASSRETGLMSWTTRLDGDSKAANKFTQSLVDMAAKTPMIYSEIDSMASALDTFGYTTEEIAPKLTSLGDTRAALGLSAQDTTYIAEALGRMKSSNKTSAEYLNMLIERGIPAYDYIAQSLGKSKESTMDMVSNGLVPGAEAAEAIFKYMGEDFADGMNLQMDTYAGKMSALASAKEELSNAEGAAYNEARKDSIQDQTDYLSGEGGEQYKQALEHIGSFKAEVENLKWEYQKDAFSAVMEGNMGIYEGTEIEEQLSEMREEWKNAIAQGGAEGAAKQDSLMMEAEVLANTEWLNSEGCQLVQQANLDLIEDIQCDSNLIGGWENAGMTMGRAFDKGLSSATRAAKDRVSAAAMPTTRNSGRYGPFRPNAWGNNRIPYDNYPAILHEGEQVLPAASVKNHNSGGGVVVNLYGTTIREDADIEKFAAALAKEIELKQSVVI